MRLKVLKKGRYTIAAVMEGEGCPAETFITSGETNYQASRVGLANMLERLASSGFANLTSSMTHEANKQHKIYELIKGDLRLFYFKGTGDVIIVCTVGVLKKTQKADKNAVAQSIGWKDMYGTALTNGTLTWETEEKT